MYYEPYKRRGARREERERRGGCLPRALWFLLKLAFRLAVLVDRGDPEYPIRADYVGFKLDLDPAHKVAVQFDEDGDEAGIFEVNWQQKPLNR